MKELKGKIMTMPVDKYTLSFVMAGVDATFDRIETTTPPFTTIDESQNDDNVISYRWGVIDAFAALMQNMSKKAIYLTDVNEWMTEKVEEFIKQKTIDEDAVPNVEEIAREFIEEFNYEDVEIFETVPPSPTWEYQDTLESYKFGWSIFFQDDATYRLQKIDDVEQAWYSANNSDDDFVDQNPYTGPKFKSDQEAAAFVQQEADNGSQLCQKAVEFLIGKRSSSVKEFDLKRNWE